MTNQRPLRNWTAFSLLGVFVFAACADAGAMAEDDNADAATAAASDVVTGSLLGLHGVTQQNIEATAEMLSDEMYAYQPTEEVRTAGGILAHIANSQYFFCSAAMGEESPNTVNLEETLQTKADIVAALGESFAYCASVYERLDDAAGAEMIPFLGGQEMAKSAVLAFNSAHNYEHYGNLVTYMRINGITPPSSQ